MEPLVVREPRVLLVPLEPRAVLLDLRVRQGSREQQTEPLVLQAARVKLVCKVILGRLEYREYRDQRVL
ncbi:MAG: hypothetical protein ACUZ8A_02655 [Candidatus Bathyanammoxibius sp.]